MIPYQHFWESFDFMNAFELKILDFIQSTFACGFLDGAMKIITAVGEAKTLIAITAVLLLFKKTRKIGIYAAVSMILGLIVANGIIKNLIDRPRPCDLNEAFNLIIERPYDSSFPSGHATACFGFTTVLMKKCKRFGIPALVLTILVAFSRLYLYLHFPTDVLTGAAIGIIMGILGCAAVDIIYKKLGGKNG